jgi:hypothetical protein
MRDFLLLRLQKRSLKLAQISQFRINASLPWMDLYDAPDTDFDRIQIF